MCLNKIKCEDKHICERQMWLMEILNTFAKTKVANALECPPKHFCLRQMWLTYNIQPARRKLKQN